VAVSLSRRDITMLRMIYVMMQKVTTFSINEIDRDTVSSGESVLGFADIMLLGLVN